MDTTEPIEPVQPAPLSQPLMELSPEARYYLHTAGRWASFLGILGFILTGLIVLGAIFAGTMLAGLSKLQSMSNPYSTPGASVFAAMSGYISFFYILIALFYFFFSFYLYKFGSEIKSGITFNNSLQVTNALKNLKSFFKLWGITTIIIIALYILIFIIVIGFVASMGHATQQV